VEFDYDEFTTVYPEFGATTLVPAPSAACQMAFYLATLNLSNCCGSPVPDANVRQALLYLLTAHVVLLFTPCSANQSQPSGAVGRISSASEGSVSGSMDFPTTAQSAWFLQTKYGAMFWNTTAPLRTMHYIPAPQGNGIIGASDIGYGPGWDNGGWM
jgi:hypothetical protein